MFCLSPQSTDPFFNLALEEYLLMNRKDDFLILYVNMPSVIIGKHQVAHRETDTEFVTENNIPVARRISGGGTVFHDEGNLNFSFISQSTEGKQIDFRKYTLPVIKFLSVMGVEARFEGKNDLKVNGLKISGNSEHVFRNRVLHHGTLLFDTKLELLRGSIRKDLAKYSTRAISSNPSPVMNLKSIIPEVRDINDLRQQMMIFFIDENGYKLIDLAPGEKKEIELLVATKYRTWEWNFAYGPEYKFAGKFEINSRPYYCSLFVKDGIIKDCIIEGSVEMTGTGRRLIGSRHMPDDLREAFMKENIIISPSEIFKFF
jgi:lipoate-protein ligase A